MDLIIRGGRVIDPGHFDGEADLYIKDGKVAALDPGGGDPAPTGKMPASSTPAVKSSLRG